MDQERRRLRRGARFRCGGAGPGKARTDRPSLQLRRWRAPGAHWLFPNGQIGRFGGVRRTLAVAIIQSRQSWRFIMIAKSTRSALLMAAATGVLAATMATDANARVTRIVIERKNSPAFDGAAFG